MSSSDLIAALQPKLRACHIREFQPEDLEACLEIHRSNQPDLLDPDSLESVTEFLTNGTSYILVIEHEGKVIACAALELTGDADIAKLYHAMVRRDFQRQGFGTTLLAARLSLLESEGGRPVHVLLRTRPEAASFHGGYGFLMHTLEKDSGTAILRLTVMPEDISAIRAALEEAGVEIVLNELPPEPAEETAGDE